MFTIFQHGLLKDFPILSFWRDTAMRFVCNYAAIWSTYYRAQVLSPWKHEGFKKHAC